jgi:hypothetical protein
MIPCLRGPKSLTLSKLLFVTCYIQRESTYDRGFKKRSWSCLDYVKKFAISIDIDVTTLIAVVAKWINHNLFIYIKIGDSGNGTGTCQIVLSRSRTIYLKPCVWYKFKFIYFLMRRFNYFLKLYSYHTSLLNN